MVGGIGNHFFWQTLRSATATNLAWLARRPPDGRRPAAPFQSLARWGGHRSTAVHALQTLPQVTEKLCKFTQTDHFDGAALLITLRSAVHDKTALRFNIFQCGVQPFAH